MHFLSFSSLNGVLGKRRVFLAVFGIRVAWSEMGRWELASGAPCRVGVPLGWEGG